MMDMYIEHYMQYLRNGDKKSENTVLCYGRDLKQFRLYCIRSGVTEPSGVTATLLNSYILYLEHMRKKPATVSRMTATVKGFFQYLMNRRMIEENPAESLKPPKVARREKTSLHENDVIKFMSVFSGNSPKELRDRAMLELLYETKIQISDLLALKLSDVNMRLDFILCRNRRPEKVVPFGKSSKEALERYLQSGRPFFAEDTESLLFTNCNGQAMSRQGFWKMIKAYGKKAGLDTEITVCALKNAMTESTQKSGMHH